MLRLLFHALLLCIQFSVSGRSPEQIEKWLEESSWSVDAQYNLGIALMEGDGVPVDKPEAFKWFKKAAEAGIAKNHWRLGLCYDEGQGVAKNPEEAFKCFEKAANKGHLTSKVRVGLSYIEGNGEEADELRGHAWILIAAADGSEAAQSYRVLLDKHIEKDQIAKAQKLAYEMMKANTHLAEYNYVPPPEEVDLYRRAAEKGHVDSMLALGLFLKDGAGIEKDSEQAARWFNLAARQGDGSSALHLSQMYLNGEGIEQDRIVANVWATVAFAKSIEGAGEILLMLNKELTEEEIDRSIKILTEIYNDHPDMMGG